MKINSIKRIHFPEIIYYWIFKIVATLNTKLLFKMAQASFHLTKVVFLTREHPEPEKVCLKVSSQRTEPKCLKIEFEQ